MKDVNSVDIYNIIQNLKKHNSNLHDIPRTDVTSKQLDLIKNTVFMGVVVNFEPIVLSAGSSNEAKWLMTITNGIEDVPIILDTPCNITPNLVLGDIIYINLEYITEKVVSDNSLEKAMSSNKSLEDMKREARLAKLLLPSIVPNLFKEVFSSNGTSSIVKVDNVQNFISKNLK